MKKTIWLALAVFLPCAGVLIVHAWHYLPFLSDDSMISFRYARRLLDGQGLTWTAGHPVEGYSNLLWLLLVALLGRFGVDLIEAARILGVLGMTAIMFSLAWWYSRRQPAMRVMWFPITLALLFLALGAPIAVWAVGGLEQPLYGALIAASVPLMFSIIDREPTEYRRTMWLSLVLGLICLTRPDGLLFAAAAAFSLLAVGWISKRPRLAFHALVAVLFPVLFSGGQLVFRLAYYGEFVPNTALVKIAASAAHWTGGAHYLSDGFRALFPFSVLALVALLGLLTSQRSRGKGIYLSSLAIAWSAYVAFIGGDVFPAYRHFVPLMVVSAFALAEGACLVAERLASRPRPFYALVILGLVALVPYTRGQGADRWIQRAITERWEWQGKEVALLLKGAFGPQQPLVAVTAAGCLPYWSELPALDMMGLNDYYLPRHRPASFGTGMVGHELGDGRYVLSQKPDLIVFDVGSAQPSWRSGEELARMAEFQDRYIPVVVRTEPGQYSAVIYANKYSDRIGITGAASMLSVPGFLFTGTNTVAYLNNANTLVGRLTSAGPVRLTVDADAAQRWSFDARASGLDGVESELRQEGRSLSITLRSRGVDAVELERVVLTGTPR